MANKPQGHKVARNNDTGRLAPMERAQQSPKKYTVEIMPNPGRGDTGRSRRK